MNEQTIISDEPQRIAAKNELRLYDEVMMPLPVYEERICLAIQILKLNGVWLDS